MNEMLVFFKIGGMFKKYQQWRYIYQDRNKQKMKKQFSFK